MSAGDGLLLAVELSGPTGSVALGTASGVLAEMSFTVPANHSAALLPAIDRIVRGSGVTPGDLRGIVVGAGPGSFTGIRIAGATAKGMAHALGIPLFAYSSLLAAAAQHAAAATGTVCAVFDARGRDVFIAAYRFLPQPETVRTPGAMTLDDAMSTFAGSAPQLWVGDGALRHRAELEARFGARVVAPAHFALPRATSLLWLGTVGPEAGRVADPGSWEPTYLRSSGAERIAAARREAGATR
jgi:tRNA threonylcarbamoyladenosine biosynthesis protein TsaB